MLDYLSAQLETWTTTADSKAPTYGRTQMGYGDKIPTAYWVHYGNTKRRVYAICFSNASTLYIIQAGKRTFVQTDDLDIGFHHIGTGNVHTFTPAHNAPAGQKAWKA